MAAPLADVGLDLVGCEACGAAEERAAEHLHRQLGEERQLEVELIQQVDFLARASFQLARDRGGMRYVDDDELAQQVGTHLRERPRHHRPPVMADQHARLAAVQRLDQLDDVVDEERHAVGIDVAWLGGVAVAAQVGSDGAKTGARERRQLPLP